MIARLAKFPIYREVLTLSKLFNFLTDVAANPQRQVAFAQSPTAVMDAAGLTQADRAILEGRQTGKIAAAFADELPVLSIAHREPDPDPSPDPDPTPDPEPPSDPDSMA